MFNYDKLVVSGRAKGVGQPWSAEELEALITLEKECKLQRTVAADYIRNGIKTPEDYEKAKKKDFKPLSIDEAKKKADEELEKEGKKAIIKHKIKNDKKK